LLARLRAGTDDRVVSFELLPRLGFELARLVHPDLIEIFGSPPDHAILMELASSSSTTDLAALLEDCLAGALAAGEITDATIAQSGAQAAGLWRWREGMVDGQYRRGPGIKHDISVPVASTPAFIVRAGAILARRHPELEALAFGHLGDGNIHYNLLQKPGTAELNLEAVTPIVNKLVHDLALEMGGSISAEHGIGQLRRSEFARRADPIELSLMRGLKSLLDPDGLMNPGKVL
jgi:FAD/FMN-containing dehydrogenase